MSRSGRFTPGESPLVPIEQKSGRVSEPVRTLWRRKDFLVLAGIRTPVEPSVKHELQCRWARLEKLKENWYQKTGILRLFSSFTLLGIEPSSFSLPARAPYRLLSKSTTLFECCPIVLYFVSRNGIVGKELRRSGRRWVNHIKYSLREQDWMVWTGFFWLRLETVVDTVMNLMVPWTLRICWLVEQQACTEDWIFHAVGYIPV